MIFVPAAGYFFKRSVRRSAGIVRMTWIVLRVSRAPTEIALLSPFLRLCLAGYFLGGLRRGARIPPGSVFPKIHAAACQEFAL